MPHLEYIFDDIDPMPDEDTPELRKNIQDYGYIIFSPEIASKMITDFYERVIKSMGKLGGIEEIIVNCWAGQSRSPVVADALNEIFALNADVQKSRLVSPNKFVYRILIEEGMRLREIGKLS